MQKGIPKTRTPYHFRVAEHDLQQVEGSNIAKRRNTSHMGGLQQKCPSLVEAWGMALTKEKDNGGTT